MMTKPIAGEQVNNKIIIAINPNLKETSFRSKYIKRLLYSEFKLLPSNIWYICENYYWTKTMELSKGNEIISNPELGWINSKLETSEVLQNNDK